MNKKLNVFLIDDNEVDLFVHREFLRISGIINEVNSFNYGGEALAILTERELKDWPDLILLDLQMPVMEGFQFLKKLEKINPDYGKKCKITMISSTLHIVDLVKVNAHPGVLELVSKPLDHEYLMQLLVKKGLLIEG